uniref:Uncharacterized protein n=1 Tax=Ascaris lumbricoides TaxID=6252 RepID=A0A0M3I0S4_ASCLU
MKFATEKNLLHSIRGNRVGRQCCGDVVEGRGMRDIRSSEEQSNGNMPTPANEFDHREERPTFHKLSDSYSDSQRSKQSHQNQRNRGRVPPKASQCCVFDLTRSLKRVP